MSELWTQKINIVFDMYHKLTKDLLQYVQLPPSNGYTSRVDNFGEVENKGIELNINSLMMEKRPKKVIRNHYILYSLGLEKLSPYINDLMKAYEAPYPSSEYKMGPRAMPSHVPIILINPLMLKKKQESFLIKLISHFFLYLLVMILLQMLWKKMY